jgi:hypothetical protein
VTWWRVTVNAAGKVTDCHKFESSIKDSNGLRVFYVEAESKVAAEAEAHRRYLEAQRTALVARRKSHKDAGRCRCGGNLTDDHLTCQRCRDKYRDYTETAAARKAGAVVAQRPKSAACAETRSFRESQTRLEVLREVRAAWLANATVGKFSKWLSSEIERLEALR